MSEKSSFSYCLLQYEHNPWLKERLNIGVFLACEPLNFFKLITRSWDGRISAAYPSLNKASFTEDLKQIERSVARFAVADSKQNTLFSSNQSYSIHESRGMHAVKIAAAIAPAADSSYRWNLGGVGLCASPEEKLQSLFNRFVSSYDGEKRQPNRSDDQVWASVSNLLVARNLAEKIEAQPVIRTDLGPIKFQAGYQNGVFHVIQPLSFDLSDEGHIGEKAAKWGGYALSVKALERRSITAQFVLGRPRKEELQPSFVSAARYLKNFVGSENVYEEFEQEFLVDKIESDLALH